MDDEALHGVLDFLREAERLKTTHRTAWTSDGHPESVAEHTWRLCLMAIVLAPEFEGVDVAKLLKICVIHDLGEALGGDIPAIDQDPGAPKSDSERRDLLTLIEPLPERARTEIVALWDEYEAAASPEARLAKALDKMETILQHNQGDNPPTFDFAFNLGYGARYTAGHPLIDRIRAILDAETRANAERSGPDPKQRFSSRVDDYVRYRPRYPAALLPLLRDEMGLDDDWTVADVGSGTGFSAEPFLAAGHRVFAVEPNAEMRRAAETLQRDNPLFHSVEGSAEATGLEPASVDLVVAGQAFHWFDPVRARAEFGRILRPPGWVVLLWNTRRTEASAFLREYEALLEAFGTDYRAVRHDRIDASVLGPFFPAGYQRRTLPNEQRLDWPGLKGRLLSSSYTPGPLDPTRAPMLERLKEMFDRHQADGVVRLEYDTEVYFGPWERGTGT